MPKQIMVTTNHQGVFAGTVPNDQDMTAESIRLTDCRLADVWDVGKDLFRLATEGPGPRSSISVPANVQIHHITAIFDVTAEAWVKWEAGTWRERAGGRAGA